MFGQTPWWIVAAFSVDKVDGLAHPPPARQRSIRVDDIYDLTESLFSGKAQEDMIAFAGFGSADSAAPCEGVLKISAFRRPDGSGYLTLTFVIDLEGGQDDKRGFEARFSRADQGRLTERLGPNFEMLLEVPLNSFAASPRFFVDEFNLYFKHLSGEEQVLLEERVLPALSDLLELRFGALESVHASARGCSSNEIEVRAGLTAALTRRVDEPFADAMGQSNSNRSSKGND